MENKTKRLNVEETPTSKRKKTDVTSTVNINETYAESSFLETLSECFTQKTKATFGNMF